MKSPVAVLALGALACTLVSPLGAAIWGGPHPFCGCSPDACHCPHGGDRDERAHREHAHDGPPHHGPWSHSATQPRPAHTGSADHSHKLAVPVSKAKDADGRCEVSGCDRGSMPGAGALPALSEGELLDSMALPAPDPCGTSDPEDLSLPPDVFPGVEPPPPRR